MCERIFVGIAHIKTSTKRNRPPERDNACIFIRKSWNSSGVVGRPTYAVLHYGISILYHRALGLSDRCLPVLVLWREISRYSVFHLSAASGGALSSLIQLVIWAHCDAQCEPEKCNRRSSEFKACLFAASIGHLWQN